MSIERTWAPIIDYWAVRFRNRGGRPIKIRVHSLPEGRQLSQGFPLPLQHPKPSFSWRDGALSRVLLVVSTKPQMVACSGCPATFKQTVDGTGNFRKTLHSLIRFKNVGLRAIMHRDTYSVFKRIGLFSFYKTKLYPSEEF